MKRDDHTSDAPPGAPAPPSPARSVFGDRLDLAVRYAERLADSGVSHGLIGPRETPRLWDRHLMNCAVTESVLPYRTRLVDVGSGAGLPGLVLAIARPDIEVSLVEPMLRRTTWLEESIAELNLSNVTVHRGRAQELWGRLRAPIVTARAVARLGELSSWCLPLLEPHGRLLALKGESAAAELAAEEAMLRKLGVVESRVILLGEDLLETPTRLVELTVGGEVPRVKVAAARKNRKSKGRGGRRKTGPDKG